MRVIRALFLATLAAFIGGQAQAWELSSSSDPFTDEVTHSARIDDWGESVSFLVSCSARRGFNTAFGWFGDAHRKMYGSGIPVRWRLGAMPAQFDEWQGIPDGNVVWDGFSARRLFDYLVNGEGESTNLIASSRGNMLSLDIAGFGEMIIELENRCR